MALRSQLRSLVAGMHRHDLVLDRIDREARDGYLPANLRQITYGIKWALETGRLPGKADYMIRHLKAQEIARLVADMHIAGIECSGDVPRALIARFA
jgi:hypothetical protein